jgi:hypothetical protein
LASVLFDGREQCEDYRLNLTGGGKIDLNWPAEAKVKKAPRSDRCLGRSATEGEVTGEKSSGRN